MLQPLRLMLLPVVFVFIGWCYCQYSGRCYNHLSIMCWLMLLPSGRWNSYCRVVDVKWLMLLPLGRCYSPGSIIYFNLSSGMLKRTSSHICGRWYLPTFPFRDGLLTLMWRASFFLRLEKAWLGARWKLVSKHKNWFCFREEPILHYVKQDEKYP